MAYREQGKVPVPLTVLLRVSSWSFVDSSSCPVACSTKPVGFSQGSQVLGKDQTFHELGVKVGGFLGQQVSGLDHGLNLLHGCGIH